MRAMFSIALFFIVILHVFITTSKFIYIYDKFSINNLNVEVVYSEFIHYGRIYIIHILL